MAESIETHKRKGGRLRDEVDHLRSEAVITALASGTSRPYASVNVTPVGRVPRGLGPLRSRRLQLRRRRTRSWDPTCVLARPRFRRSRP